jgi:hypothetical protein
VEVDVSEHFDEATARGLMLRRIEMTADNHFIPKGATARVVSIDRYDDAPEKWGVGVRWEPIEPSTPIDWFSKRQFERYFGVVRRG